MLHLLTRALTCIHTDNVCIEALSVNLNRPILESASRNLLKLSQVINDAKQSDQQRLRAEYDRLVEGLAQTGIRCVTLVVPAHTRHAAHPIRDTRDRGAL